MNTKILVPAVLITGLTVAVAGTFAATNSSTSSGENTVKHQFGMKNFGGMGKHRDGPMGGGMGGPMMRLTDAEKTALESMTPAEKQAFFEKKRTEMDAKHAAHEAVIDKLLAGTALTSDEEKVRQEIIKDRAEMKTKRTEMEANRAKIEAILAKQKAGTTLTAEEQALLDSMPKGNHEGMGMGRWMRNNTTTQTN